MRYVCPAKTRISLCIQADWFESLLGTLWVIKVPMNIHINCKDADQNKWTHRLIEVFARLTCQVK